MEQNEDMRTSKKERKINQDEETNSENMPVNSTKQVRSGFGFLIACSRETTH